MADVKSRLEVVEGDITKLDVDAIVNAANDRLARGGGVCGAIHEAAGRELAEACRKIGGCPTGEARLTPGFKLKAKHVIHAVGPVWHGGANREDALLADAYRNSLELARQHNIASIAFPAISTGIYGYPLDRATDIAVHAVADFLRTGEVPGRVIFACFGGDVAATYRTALASLR
ncbi:MAG TPA: O-acetyl-ADP-ribose deacetylase [Methylomirabilota bacterium]|nr:O-acetyl-ADP-ribose deacetylase [Methylomirabilota bacterium]